MVSLMFKFISSSGKENQFEERVVEIEKSISPIKEILAKNDFSDFSIVLNEQTISLQDCFQLQVNVKDVGSFRFIFNKEGFDKDTIINKISSLKDIEVVDVRTAQAKIEALLSIVDIPSLLFMVYEEIDDFYIDSNYFYYLMNHNIQTFLIKKEKEDLPLFELNIGDDIIETKPVKKKKIFKGISKESTKRFLKQLSDKKFHFLLLVVSTTLLEVSIPLAIVNVYAKNAIYIFLFICSLIGIAMNGYSYYDLFRKHHPKEPLCMASYIANAFGIGAGVGLFALFYSLSNFEEGVPAVGSMILVGLLVSLIICGATIAITFFLPKRKPRSKKNI